jgi:hypothetical protein
MRSCSLALKSPKRYKNGRGSTLTLKATPMTCPLFVKFKKMFAEHKRPHSGVVEGDGKPMWHIPGLAFKNWGHTVSNNPSDSFVARTVVGVQNLVKWAKA